MIKLIKATKSSRIKDKGKYILCIKDDMYHLTKKEIIQFKKVLRNKKDKEKV